MATINTKVGTLQFNPGQPTVEKINVSGISFENDLKEDMLAAQQKLNNKSILLAKALFISSADMAAMIDQAAGNPVMIFYMTEGETTNTLTIITADMGLEPQIGAGDSKWKLKVTLPYDWVSTDPLVANPVAINEFRIDDIFNPLLPAFSDKEDAGTTFMSSLINNSKSVLEQIENGSLPLLRIAVGLTDELGIFANAQKYNGVLLYLNYAAEDRIISIPQPVGVVAQRKKFASLSWVGVGKNWEVLAKKGEEKLTLSGICPPDCPVYHNNVI